MIRDLCLLCGYDLNPPDSKGGMDQETSYIEMVTRYMIDGKSPLVERQPELGLYRDMVFLYKLSMADHTHRRAIKLKRWTKDQGVLDWSIKGLYHGHTISLASS